LPLQASELEIQRKEIRSTKHQTVRTVLLVVS